MIKRTMLAKFKDINKKKRTISFTVKIFNKQGYFSFFLKIKYIFEYKYRILRSRRSSCKKKVYSKGLLTKYRCILCGFVLIFFLSIIKLRFF